MKTLPIAILCGATLALTTGCDTTTGQGAGFGAGTGAIIGGIAGGDVRSAAIGAGAGALAGAVVGTMVQNERDRTAVGGTPAAGIPVATPSQHRGFVVSPFRPNALVDVRGIPRGARVMDPQSRQIFINP